MSKNTFFLIIYTALCVLINFGMYDIYGPLGTLFVFTFTMLGNYMTHYYIDKQFERRKNNE